MSLTDDETTDSSGEEEETPAVRNKPLTPEQEAAVQTMATERAKAEAIFAATSEAAATKTMVTFETFSGAILFDGPDEQEGPCFELTRDAERLWDMLAENRKCAVCQLRFFLYKKNKAGQLVASLTNKNLLTPENLGVGRHVICVGVQPYFSTLEDAFKQWPVVEDVADKNKFVNHPRYGFESCEAYPIVEFSVTCGDRGILNDTAANSCRTSTVDGKQYSCIWHRVAADAAFCITVDQTNHEDICSTVAADGQHVLEIPGGMPFTSAFHITFGGLKNGSKVTILAEIVPTPFLADVRHFVHKGKVYSLRPSLAKPCFSCKGDAGIDLPEFLPLITWVNCEKLAYMHAEECHRSDYLAILFCDKMKYLEPEGDSKFPLPWPSPTPFYDLDEDGTYHGKKWFPRFQWAHEVVDGEVKLQKIGNYKDKAEGKMMCADVLYEVRAAQQFDICYKGDVLLSSERQEDGQHVCTCFDGIPVSVIHGPRGSTAPNVTLRFRDKFQPVKDPAIRALLGFPDVVETTDTKNVDSESSSSCSIAPGSGGGGSKKDADTSPAKLLKTSSGSVDYMCTGIYEHSTQKHHAMLRRCKFLGFGPSGAKIQDPATLPSASKDDDAGGGGAK